MNGFLAADQVLNRMPSLLRDVIVAHGTDQDYISHPADDHFVLEDGAWMYVKDSREAKQIDPYPVFYTLNNTNHRLYGLGGTEFTDDEVFDHDHVVWDVEAQQWDDMLAHLNVYDPAMKVG